MQVCHSVGLAQDGKTPAQFESNEAIVTISIVENPGERSRVTIESELVDITGEQ